jgi:hypothetical protein
MEGITMKPGETSGEERGVVDDAKKPGRVRKGFRYPAKFEGTRDGLGKG